MKSHDPYQPADQPGVHTSQLTVDEYRRLAEFRRHFEHRTSLAVEAAKMATWEWELGTDEVFWNRRHFELLGLPFGENPQHAEVFMTRIHPEDQSRITNLLMQSIERQELFDADFRIIRADDHRVRWMSGYGRITGILDGTATTMSGVMVDITDRKVAEERIKEEDRRKDEFLATLAHELRNPMATVRNGLNILQILHEPTSNTGEVITMMNRQVVHLVRLVDDLLDVSRIGQGKIELQKERINLVEQIRQAVEAVSSLFREREHTLRLNLPKAPVYLLGDATRITQVATNLLTNAGRYTPNGGEVNVSLEPGDEQSVLRVRDNGIGLTEEQLGKIFDLFVQVDNSVARSQGGLGLGLTLVKQLVEMHGGQVAAHSPGLGLGSEFVIYLPQQ